MAILGSNAIKRLSRIFEPYDERYVEPASYDLHLASLAILLPESHLYDPKDPLTYGVGTVIEIEGDGYTLPNNRLLLASTVEVVSLPKDIAGRIEGKSSLGRQGLPVHVTAGYIDPEFTGPITLELHTICGLRTVLYPGMPIAQLSLHSVVEYGAGYRGKYRFASGAQESRYYLNWDGEEWL